MINEVLYEQRDRDYQELRLKNYDLYLYTIKTAEATSMKAKLDLSQAAFIEHTFVNFALTLKRLYERIN